MALINVPDDGLTIEIPGAMLLHIAKDLSFVVTDQTTEIIAEGQDIRVLISAADVAKIYLTEMFGGWK